MFYPPEGVFVAGAQFLMENRLNKNTINPFYPGLVYVGLSQVKPALLILYLTFTVGREFQLLNDHSGKVFTNND